MTPKSYLGWPCDDCGAITLEFRVTRPKRCHCGSLIWGMPVKVYQHTQETWDSSQQEDVMPDCGAIATTKRREINRVLCDQCLSDYWKNFYSDQAIDDRIMKRRRR